MADTMEENIPIESESRKKFEKTVKGIKKMLKKGTVKPAEQVEDIVESNVDKKKKKTFSKRDKGVVYIGHIPHGFYEEQMKSYFSQFGTVTNVKVSRSPKTGKSKGYGFVEFLDKDVAQIVAQTMNNYLMDKRLLKAEYIPPERQRLHFFKGRKWVPGKTNPAVFKRQKDVRQKNKQVTDEEWLKEAKKRIKRLHKLKIALKSAGVNYDFFQPTDVPAELADFDPAHPEKHNLKNKQSEEKKSNKTDGKESKENIASEKNKQKKIEKKSKNETELKKKVVEIKQTKSVEKTPQKNVKTPKKEKMTSPKVLALQTKTIEKKTKGISHNLINKKNKNKK